MMSYLHVDEQAEKDLLDDLDLSDISQEELDYDEDIDVNSDGFDEQ